MKTKLKMKLREISHENKVVSWIYQKASVLRVRKRRKWDDEKYLRVKFQENTGTMLDLDNPTNFNEKLQWLKLYNRQSIYSTMADKYRAKDWIESKIGTEHTIKTYGAWKHFDDIDFDTLPDRFVLKCNHDCGSVVICLDKNHLDMKTAKKKLESALDRNYYWVGREWPYKDIDPLIFAEAYLVDESGRELKDYKFFCFNGEVKLIQVDFDRVKNHRRNIYNLDWQLLDLSIQYPRDPLMIIEKPAALKEMIDAAKKLSEGMPFLRVDFYSIYNNFYVGELTFYHGGGMERFDPPEWNERLGEWIDLKGVAK